MEQDVFPKHLGNLVYNIHSGCYEITEYGIVYQLTQQQASSITQEFRSIAEWYDNLSRFTKMQISLVRVID